MTDFSNMTPADLEASKCINIQAIDRYDAHIVDLEWRNQAIDAEIERRKAEPDHAAWEPKWQAFRKAMRWPDFTAFEEKREQQYIRASIAAHNTQLAGEWTEWKRGMPMPEGVTLETHEINVFHDLKKSWVNMVSEPTWKADLYRYRPRQS